MSYVKKLENYDYKMKSLSNALISREYSASMETYADLILKSSKRWLKTHETHPKKFLFNSEKAKLKSSNVRINSHEKNVDTAR